MPGKNKQVRKKVIYMCVTGGYDAILDPEYVSDEYDYICFVDREPSGKSKVWEFRPLAFTERDQIRNARWHKTHPHILFPEYEESIWMDGNIVVLNDNFFSSMILGDSDEVIRIARHPHTKTLHEEYEANRRLSKDDLNLINLEEQAIINKGFNGDYENETFFETNVIWRRHHAKKCIQIMDDWWWWIENYSYRDQLSCTYVLWEHKLSVKYLFKQNLRTADFVKFVTTSAHQNPNELKAIIDRQRATIELKDRQLEQKNSQISEILNSRSYRLSRKIAGVYHQMRGTKNDDKK